MEKIKSYAIITLVVIAVASLTGIAAFFYGRNTKANEVNSDEIKVTSKVVVDRITDQYFVVTKTVFVDQESTITIKENSDWSDFLWKEQIIAEALVRVDVGVDMSEISAGDVEIDEEEMLIKLTIPSATVLDSSLDSELEVDEKNGVITSIGEIFEEGTEDYNLASATLIDEAEEEVRNDTEIINEAEVDAANLIEIVLQDTGYDLEIFIR